MYEQASSHRWHIRAHLVVWSSLCILLVYSYGYFFQASYLGFNWGANGRISELYIPTTQLYEGDQLLQIGSVRWTEFTNNLRQSLLDPPPLNNQVPLLVQRGTEQLEITWALPGVNPTEYWARFSSGWWLGYLFWFACVGTLLVVRPRDERWIVLLIFTSLTAFWLVLGSGISRRHLWGAAVLLRVALWLCVPVYLHLHWLFPEPLGKLTKPFRIVLYGVGITGAIMEWLGLLGLYAHLVAFLLCLVGSLGLLLIRYFRQPTLKHKLTLLVGATVIAFLPAFAISLARFFVDVPPMLSGGSVLGFPLIPLAYFYVASWGQRGWLELRVNPLVTIYLFVCIAASLFIPIVSVIYGQLGIPSESLVITLVSFIAALIIAIRMYPSFRLFIDRYLLRVPLVSEEMLQSYIQEITTSPDRDSLRKILESKVLPTLRVKQSVLLYFEESQDWTLVHEVGLGNAFCLPSDKQIALLQSKPERYFSPTDDNEITRIFPWLRLILILRLEGKTLGLWLLGSRDPDDFYARKELPTFRALANQTTLALTNITKSERLAALYKANVERSEEERAALARDLHDEILGNLALLKTSLDPDVISERFEDNYILIKQRIRQLTTNLRPAMLTYGLGPALSEYVSSVRERYTEEPQIHFSSLSDTLRYPPFVELEVFRVIQQAVENTLHSAKASVIEIGGQMEEGRLDLFVRDNGIGFPGGTRPNLNLLVEQKHYGIIGMYERASIIEADLFIDPRRDNTSGIQVRIVWTRPQTTT